MKQIKFRQKAIDGNGNKGLHYWGFMSNGHFIQPIVSKNGTYWTALENSEQFTRLLDKNGKRIYEGDIVNEGFDDLFEITKGFAGKDLNNEPECWVGIPIGKGNDSDIFSLSFNQAKDCEVIGNIYENKEKWEEEFDNMFDWADQVKEKEMARWEIMYGFTPKDIKQFIKKLLKEQMEGN